MSTIPPVHILILEANPLDTDVLRDTLTQAGVEFDSVCVDNETDFINHLSENLDLILADYLPQFSALKALHILQASGLDVPFIVVTGAVNEVSAIECMKRGAADYLLKDHLTRLEQAVVKAVLATIVASV